jgi:hypothetical protein
LRLEFCPRDSHYGVYIRFTSPPQYRLYRCVDSWRNFPTNLPTTSNKVWRITLTRTSGIRLFIHCNGVEVLNYLISSSTCSSSYWTYWHPNVKRLYINSGDTASDSYRPYRGETEIRINYTIPTNS